MVKRRHWLGRKVGSRVVGLEPVQAYGVLAAGAGSAVHESMYYTMRADAWAGNPLLERSTKLRSLKMNMQHGLGLA